MVGRSVWEGESCFLLSVASVEKRESECVLSWGAGKECGAEREGEGERKREAEREGEESAVCVCVCVKRECAKERKESILSKQRLVHTETKLFLL